MNLAGVIGLNAKVLLIDGDPQKEAQLVGLIVVAMINHFLLLL